MQIFVKFPSGHTGTIEAEGTHTVDTFLENLFNNEFAHLQNISEFKLLFGRHRLDTELNKTLSQFDIHKESTLILQTSPYNSLEIIKEKRLLDKKLEGLEGNYLKLNQLVKSLFANFRVIMESQNAAEQGGGYISKRKKRKTKKRKKGK